MKFPLLSEKAIAKMSDLYGFVNKLSSLYVLTATMHARKRKHQLLIDKNAAELYKINQNVNSTVSFAVNSHSII